MMKVRNLLFGAIVAMLPMAIASCNKEKEETTPSTSVDVTKVVGTYDGYTLASSAYFQNNFTRVLPSPNPATKPSTLPLPRALGAQPQLPMPLFRPVEVTTALVVLAPV